MGLDMYLIERQRFCGGTMYVTVEGKDDYIRVDDGKSVTIERNAGYWRKANAIHRWFVDNVQGGNDDCNAYPVSDEQLRQLHDICQQVLDSVEMVEGTLNVGTSFGPNGAVEQLTEQGMVIAQPAIAEKLLPTQAGFFFGSTEYNEFYLDDIKHTVEVIKPLLDGKHGEIFYQSSW